MKLELTRRGSYAIRAAIALARIDGRNLTSASRIAAAMGIPPRFLPQVMGDLVRAGIVEGVVGRSGGYRLVRDPEQITLLEVITAAEGDNRRRTCVLRGVECGLQSSACDVHDVFAAAQAALLLELGGATLAQVLATSPAAGAGPGEGSGSGGDRGRGAELSPAAERDEG